jgi:signal transduction histidine kinase
VFAAFSVVVMGALLVLIYWWMSSLLERHLQEAVQRQRAVLLDDFAQDGRESMLELVRQYTEKHNASPVHFPVHFLAQDKVGNPIAGDLPPMKATEGWQEFSLPPSSAHGDTTARVHRGLGTWIDVDTFLLVTHDTGDLNQTRKVLVGSFSTALAVTVLLALVGGLSIGAVLLRRVEGINRTARAIMDGDLSKRIPVDGRRDELNGLAESLNRMLARIEELMENLRHVTNDVAHDLRSPLGRLRQRLEASRLKQCACAEYETAIDAAIDDTNVILNTFDAMLRIAQVEAGARRARFSAVDLSVIATTIAEAFAPVAEDESRRFVTHIEPGVTAKGDRELITQMLANLIENSLRHTSSGTALGLRVERVEGTVYITVADEGSGIPVGERERVLCRFYRLDASRTTPGSGLGLSLVAAVVKLHDAQISLEDNEPGLRVVIVFS